MAEFLLERIDDPRITEKLMIRNTKNKYPIGAEVIKEINFVKMMKPGSNVQMEKRNHRSCCVAA